MNGSARILQRSIAIDSSLTIAADQVTDRPQVMMANSGSFLPELFSCDRSNHNGQFYVEKKTFLGNNVLHLPEINLIQIR
jgi:hypothetical protein